MNDNTNGVIMNDNTAFLDQWKDILTDREDYIVENKSDITQNGWNHFISLLRNEFLKCIYPEASMGFKTSGELVNLLNTKSLDIVTKTNPSAFYMAIVRSASYVHMAESSISSIDEKDDKTDVDIKESYLSKSFLSEIKLLTDFMFNGKSIKEFMESLVAENPDDKIEIDSVISSAVETFLTKYVNVDLS